MDRPPASFRLEYRAKTSSPVTRLVVWLAGASLFDCLRTHCIQSAPPASGACSSFPCRDGLEQGKREVWCVAAIPSGRRDKASAAPATVISFRCKPETGLVVKHVFHHICSLLCR